jgi:hypothetical protein
MKKLSLIFDIIGVIAIIGIIIKSFIEPLIYDISAYDSLLSNSLIMIIILIIVVAKILLEPLFKIKN